MTLKDRIRIRRTEKGMTMDELASAIGVRKQTIFKYENGIITNIPSDKIEKIATALGTTPSFLMGWKEPEEEPTGYYNDPEVAEMVEKLRNNPNGRILFDASSDLSMEDIEIVLNLIKGLKAKEGKH